MSEAILARFQEQTGERLALLRLASETAAGLGIGLYWVGGGVRDLWLGRNELDLDLVVDGDLESFAERLAARLGSPLQSHPQFMTAQVDAPAGLRIDLARARTERYTAPAALPVVEPGALESDLWRRDFTVNCLAIALEPGFGKTLLDPCGGLLDLERNLLRTLHGASFHDDPTRILRAVEFSARLGFELARETRAEAEKAISSGVLALLSPARLCDALRRALGRPESVSSALRRLHELRLLEVVAEWTGDISKAAGCFDAARLERAARTAARVGSREGAPDGGSFGLALLCLALDQPAANRSRLAASLALTHAERDLLTRAPERVAQALRTIAGSPRPSAAHAVLGALTDEELAVIAAHGGREQAWVAREYGEMRGVGLAISGRDLIAAGMAAGPALGRVLERTLRAKLDGEIGSAGELAFALGALSEIAQGSGLNAGESGGRE